MEAVVRSPGDYARKKLRFTSALLSGRITTYDVAGVRKYYLTVASRNGSLEAGFFLAPPALADKLTRLMDLGRNYAVNLTCKVKAIAINGFTQWQGIVTRVAFRDGQGHVVRTVTAAKK
jgi:hypothetical protein